MEYTFSINKEILENALNKFNAYEIYDEYDLICFLDFYIEALNIILKNDYDLFEDLLFSIKNTDFLLNYVMKSFGF